MKEIERLQKRLEREKKARKEAEAIMEAKSMELYLSNTRLTQINQNLERIVADRTEALRKNLMEVEKINAELMELAYVVSHDLRGSVRQIGGLVGLIEEELIEKEDCAVIADDYLPEIQSRACRMYHFLDGIREYISIGRQYTEVQEVVLEEEISRMIFEFKNPNKVKIQLLTPLPTLLANLHRCNQIFMHILENAINYHHQPKNGTIDISFEKMEHHFTITIADNGPGIEEKHHERIFRMFQLLSTRKQNEGKGIGLPIVKKIIENMNGVIRLESKLGAGAKFIIELPNELLINEA